MSFAPIDFMVPVPADDLRLAILMLRTKKACKSLMSPADREAFIKDLEFRYVLSLQSSESCDLDSSASA